MNVEERGIYDEMKHWAELLMPYSNEPRPVRMEVGPDVVDVLKERFAPILYPNAATRWQGSDAMFGVPIMSLYVLARGAWRILDQFGKVMSSGGIES